MSMFVIIVNCRMRVFQPCQRPICGTTAAPVEQGTAIGCKAMVVRPVHALRRR